MSLFRLARRRAAGAPWLARRLLHFWIVWTMLLFVHEGGHSLAAREQGLDVRRVTVGMGPSLLRSTVGDVDLVVRLVPIAGMTTVRGIGDDAVADSSRYADGPLGHAVVLGAGIAATLAFAVGVAGFIGLREQVTGRRAAWSRAMLADALVLSVFNLLPVPPLDGGRAALDTITAIRGAPLSGDALLWLQVGGLALAIVPMTLWTRWTSGIDRVAMRWRAPAPARVHAAPVAVHGGPEREKPRVAA